MKNVPNHQAQTKTWYRKLLDLLLQKGCCSCSEGEGCANQDCSCTNGNTCAIREWLEKSDGAITPPDPGQPTLTALPAGERAHVNQLLLPPAQKKRLLSLGLTSGTEVTVVNNENGRLIIAVRDSRLGLSPDVASKITYRVA